MPRTYTHARCCNRRSQEPIEIYERMFGDLLQFYENNHHYFILSLDDEGCLVEVCSNPDVAEALSLYHLGSSDLCQTRAGVMASAPGYIGLPSAEVTEVTCVHRGDVSCRFEINVGFANRVAKQLATA
jgi:predicted hydrocarbon binding protein